MKSSAAVLSPASRYSLQWILHRIKDVSLSSHPNLHLHGKEITFIFGVKLLLQPSQRPCRTPGNQNHDCSLSSRILRSYSLLLRLESQNLRALLTLMIVIKGIPKNHNISPGFHKFSNTILLYSHDGTIAPNIRQCESVQDRILYSVSWNLHRLMLRFSSIGMCRN